MMPLILLIIQPFEAYIKEYEKRCYYFGGRFYENALIIGGPLAGGTEKQLAALQIFGKLVGTGLQIVNDIGDFVPPDKKPYAEAFKYYQDQYGDIRQGKLTLPIYIMLQNAPPNEKAFILSKVGKKQTDTKDGYKLTGILIKTNAVEKCKRLTKEYVNKAKKQLDIFEKSRKKDLLSAVTSNVKSSVYWKILKSIALE